MTTKRFDALLHDPITKTWVPGTLVIDSVSTRSDTLSVTFHGTRGEGERLARGESFTEGVGSGPSVPRGYDIVVFTTGRDGDPRPPIVVASIVAAEILQATRQFRRTKPKTPRPKTANDEIRVCVCCGARTMAKSADGWKGIQMHPDRTAVDYYCNKIPCIERRDAAIEEAKVNWGYGEAPKPAVTPGVTQVTSPADDKGTDQKNYGPPPEKPFL